MRHILLTAGLAAALFAPAAPDSGRPLQPAIARHIAAQQESDQPVEAEQLPEPGQQPQAELPTPETIDQWLRDLESPRLRVREEATASLIAAGAAALERVAQAAPAAKGEAAMRMVHILATWAGGNDPRLASRARAVLRELAASQDPDLARRAADALAPLPQAADPQAAEPPAFLPGAARQVRVTQRADAAGNRTTEIHADGAHVTIEESPQAGIKVTVRPAGKADEPAKTYQAEDVRELKERHPEAYRWYREYVERQAARLRWPLGPGMQGILPRRPLLPGFGVNTQQALEEIKAAQQQLEAVQAALLKAAAEGEASAERLKELAAELRAAQQRLQAAEEALEDAEAFPFPLPQLPQPFLPPQLPLPPVPPIEPPPLPGAPPVFDRT
ncbi:MAG: hypothetical protein K6T86_02520 [Pirellulales bacterium]|nr:hypothetical protein [Pirellulales bacterium]